MKLNQLKTLLFIASVGFLIWTCGQLQPLPENPFDPLNPNYKPPKTQLTDWPSGLIKEKSVTFRWKPANTSYNSDSIETELYGDILYSYQLNDDLWSPWFTGTSVTLQYLDDTTYTFTLRSKYPTNIAEESPYPTRSFTMEAFSSALMFYPRTEIIANNSSNLTFLYTIGVEEVNNFMGAHIIIEYNPAIVKPLRAEILNEDGGFLAQNSGTVVTPPTNEFGFVSIDSIAGELVLDLIIVENPDGLSGSGELFDLTFERILSDSSNSDTLYFNFGEKSVIRNSANEDILKDLGNGVVYVW